jgi:hypothetical protein
MLDSLSSVGPNNPDIDGPSSKTVSVMVNNLVITATVKPMDRSSNGAF